MYSTMQLATKNEPAVRRDKFLELAAVTGLVGLQKSTVYRLIREGQFPAPLRIGPRTSRWVESSVLTWIQERIASGGALPPVQGKGGACNG